MSTAATWGSESGNHYQGTEVRTKSGGEEHSALDAYLEHPESHEKTALGHGTTNKRRAVRKHKEKMKKEIKKSEKSFPK